MTHRSELTEDEFDARYPLIVNHLNPSAGWAFDGQVGCLFETFGPEFEFVRQQDPQRVWTLVDADDGHIAVIGGLHYVNRIGYLISQSPLPRDEEVYVHIPCSNHDGGASVTNSSEMTNIQRAARVERILKRYQTGDDDLQTCLADVLTDAMHWCDSTGLDFPSISGQAYRYYIEELGEQPVTHELDSQSPSTHPKGN